MGATGPARAEGQHGAELRPVKETHGTAGGKVRKGRRDMPWMKEVRRSTAEQIALNATTWARMQAQVKAGPVAVGLQHRVGTHVRNQTSKKFAAHPRGCLRMQFSVNRLILRSGRHTRPSRLRTGLQTIISETGMSILRVRILVTNGYVSCRLWYGSTVECMSGAA